MKFVYNPFTNKLDPTDSGGSSTSSTPYVVGPTARYQTIQEGINAANADGGGVVLVQPGTYTENLTLYSHCHVMGLDFADAGGGVEIVGVHTPPASGGFVFNNVLLESATHIFSSAVAGTAHLLIANAAIVVTNGFTFNVPNWSGKLEVWDVNDRGSTNDGFVNNTGGSEIAIFSAAVGAGTGNTMLVSGSVSIFTCDIGCPINVTTGATAYLEYNVHTAPITLSGDSTGEIIGSEIDSSITMSSNAAWLISMCVINTSTNPAIGGAGIGALTISDVTYISNSTVAGTLTVSNVGLTDLGSIRSNFTAHGVLLGQGNRGTVTSLTPGTSGTILQSQGAGSDPAFSTATYPSTAGTSGNVLTSNGTNWLSSTPTSFTSAVTQTFTASGTYTPTSGMKYCLLEVIGGGGGGGGAGVTGASTVSNGGGGGAGGYARKLVTAAAIGASQVVTIGAAGTAGANTGGNAGTGGTSSVGAIVSATGGSGGFGTVAGASNSPVGVNGGTGGVGSSGDFNSKGSGGTAGFGMGGGGAAAWSVGGAGGSSILGGGAVSRYMQGGNNSPGYAGGNYGGGGGGAALGVSQAGQVGGAGAAGIVYITEYI